MKIRFALAALLATAIAPQLFAQVVYEGVRYQYGKYNEVYYGGTNPGYTNNTYVYLPPALQPAYAAQRLATPPGVNGYMPAGPNGPFFSPYTPDATNSASIFAPYVFSDYLPYQEVGQFGFTPDDARNEAYSHIPLYQGPIVAPAPVGSLATPAPQPSHATAANISPRDKAIPLLSWAKAERTRNPQLYKALLDEARKYDPTDTEAMEHSVASEK